MTERDERDIHPIRSIGEAAGRVATLAHMPGPTDMIRSVYSITETITDAVHRLDLAILDGRFATADSMSAIRLEGAADKLRRLAEDLDNRRRQLIDAEPVLPLEAAE